MIRQGQETYGRKRSAAVSRDEPGRVSTAVNCVVGFFSFFFLFFATFGVTLLAFQVCARLCVQEERPA